MLGRGWVLTTLLVATAQAGPDETDVSPVFEADARITAVRDQLRAQRLALVDEHAITSPADRLRKKLAASEAGIARLAAPIDPLDRWTDPCREALQGLSADKLDPIAERHLDMARCWLSVDLPDVAMQHAIQVMLLGPEEPKFREAAELLVRATAVSADRSEIEAMVGWLGTGMVPTSVRGDVLVVGARNRLERGGDPVTLRADLSTVDAIPMKYEATWTLGLMEVAAGRGKAASKYWKDTLKAGGGRGPGEAEELASLAGRTRLAVARVYLHGGGDDAAGVSELCGRLDATSSWYADGLACQAWAKITLNDAKGAAKAVKTSQGLQRPWAPEVAQLAGMVELERCKHDKGLDLLQDFVTTWGRKRDDLYTAVEPFAATVGATPPEVGWTNFGPRSDALAPDGLWSTIVRDRAVGPLSRRIAQLDAEEAELTKLARSWPEGPIAHAREVVTTTRRRLRRLAGAATLEAAAAELDLLDRRVRFAEGLVSRGITELKKAGTSWSGATCD